MDDETVAGRVGARVVQVIDVTEQAHVTAAAEVFPILSSPAASEKSGGRSAQSSQDFFTQSISLEVSNVASSVNFEHINTRPPVAIDIASSCTAPIPLVRHPHELHRSLAHGLKQTPKPFASTSRETLLGISRETLILSSQRTFPEMVRETSQETLPEMSTVTSIETLPEMLRETSQEALRGTTVETLAGPNEPIRPQKGDFSPTICPMKEGPNYENHCNQSIQTCSMSYNSLNGSLHGNMNCHKKEDIEEDNDENGFRENYDDSKDGDNGMNEAENNEENKRENDKENNGENVEEDYGRNDKENLVQIHEENYGENDDDMQDALDYAIDTFDNDLLVTTDNINNLDNNKDRNDGNHNLHNHNNSLWRDSSTLPENNLTQHPKPSFTMVSSKFPPPTDTATTTSNIRIGRIGRIDESSFEIKVGIRAASTKTTKTAITTSEAERRLLSPVTEGSVSGIANDLTVSGIANDLTVSGIANDLTAELTTILHTDGNAKQVLIQEETSNETHASSTRNPHATHNAEDKDSAETTAAEPATTTRHSGNNTGRLVILNPVAPLQGILTSGRKGKDEYAPLDNHLDQHYQGNIFTSTIINTSNVYDAIEKTKVSMRHSSKNVTMYQHNTVPISVTGLMLGTAVVDSTAVNTSPLKDEHHLFHTPSLQQPPSLQPQQITMPTSNSDTWLALNVETLENTNSQKLVTEGTNINYSCGTINNGSSCDSCIAITSAMSDSCFRATNKRGREDDGSNHHVRALQTQKSAFEILSSVQLSSGSYLENKSNITTTTTNNNSNSNGEINPDDYQNNNVFIGSNATQPAIKRPKTRNTTPSTAEEQHDISDEMRQLNNKSNDNNNCNSKSSSKHQISNIVRCNKIVQQMDETESITHNNSSTKSGIKIDEEEEDEAVLLVAKAAAVAAVAASTHPTIATAVAAVPTAGSATKSITTEIDQSRSFHSMMIDSNTKGSHKSPKLQQQSEADCLPHPLQTPPENGSKVQKQLQQQSKSSHSTIENLTKQKKSKHKLQLQEQKDQLQQQTRPGHEKQQKQQCQPKEDQKQACHPRPDDQKQPRQSIEDHPQQSQEAKRTTNRLEKKKKQKHKTVQDTISKHTKTGCDCTGPFLAQEYIDFASEFMLQPLSAPPPRREQQSNEDEGSVNRSYYQMHALLEPHTSTTSTSGFYYGFQPDGTNYPLECISVLGYLTSPFRRPHVLERWSPYEIAMFEGSIAIYGKNFYKISNDVLSKSKTTGQVIEFYYIWKKTTHYQRWKRSYNNYNNTPSTSVATVIGKNIISSKSSQPNVGANVDEGHFVNNDHDNGKNRYQSDNKHIDYKHDDDDIDNHLDSINDKSQSDDSDYDSSNDNKEKDE